MVSDSIDKDQKLQLLIQKAIAGNEQAFGQIYDVYFEKIYRFIFFRVNHRETAEDLVADTFIRAWDRLSALNDTSAFAGWIYQIARNLVIDHYRSRKTTVDIQTLENVLEYEDNIIEQTNLDFELKKFLAVLKQLPQDQQIVLKLKFMDELDNSEIAKILDKTQGAIRVIQHRAIIQLKKLLENNET